MIDENHIEVRAYELHKDKLKLIHCTALDYKFCAHEKCEYMILSLAQQKKGKFLNTQQSKFPPYSYYGIYKFLWKPKKPIKDLDDVSISFDTKTKLSEIWKKVKKEKNL